MIRLADPTKEFVRQYAGRLPHAQLLSGPSGVGLKTLALHLAESNGQVLALILPEPKTATSLPSISVERIRKLYDTTKSRFEVAHFVIIDDSDKLNHAAQNALLKLLEEPAESVHFILTSHRPELLLPTIRSRLAAFPVPQLPSIESKRLLKSLGATDEMTQRRIMFAADGLPAEIARLASDKSSMEELSNQVQAARRFIEGSTYQRLAFVASLKEDRQAAIALIAMIITLLRRSLGASANTATIRLIDSLLLASQHIQANGNIKLQMATAVLVRDRSLRYNH